MKNLRDLYKVWLDDAYAMENDIIEMLEAQVKEAAEYPELEMKLQEHLGLTRKHVELVKVALERIGEKPSVIKSGMSKMMGAVKAAIPDGEDKLIKSGAADLVTEHMEMGAYENLIMAAEELGEDQAKDSFKEILKDEEDMAKWLKNNLPKIMDDYYTMEEE